MSHELNEQRRLAGLPELSEENPTGIEPSEQRKVKAIFDGAFKKIIDLVDPKGLDTKAQHDFVRYLRVLIDYHMGGLFEQVEGESPLDERRVPELRTVHTLLTKADQLRMEIVGGSKTKDHCDDLWKLVWAAENTIEQLEKAIQTAKENALSVRNDIRNVCGPPKYGR